MRKLDSLIASFNNSITQRKMTFRVPNTSLNYRVVKNFWRLNYLSTVVKDNFYLVVTHRLDNSGNPIIRNVRSLYNGTGRKYVSVKHGMLEKMVRDRGGNTLLLTSRGIDGLSWINEAYSDKVGGILLLQIYF